jgi:hypothetical protein
MTPTIFMAKIHNDLNKSENSLQAIKDIITILKLTIKKQFTSTPHTSMVTRKYGSAFTK